MGWGVGKSCNCIAVVVGVEKGRGMGMGMAMDAFESPLSELVKLSTGFGLQEVVATAFVEALV